ncbi:MarR family winged helix-turn-helix transcriptional regulator [Cohnella herbarum]|uniref:MarR family transcriptional regulator n=1 Tax=Cohnella herbarum TaxID=2728023 RepID=A0A7Z2ZN39_9BACL|nr:MarR family transcriptional regulator [Cohnella herbarum]QJD85445.1 MarR family transcriptional regulator [Cohnella herbarum]
MNDTDAVVLKLRLVKNTLSSYFMKTLPQYGITPIMMYVMEYLRSHAEAIAVDIANEFGMTRGAVSQLLDKLEEHQLVVRKPHPTSRRSLQIEITPKGNEIIDQMLRAYNTEIEQLVTSYSPEERKALRLLLDKLPL